MRPIPWMLRLGLVAVGFGAGLSNGLFNSTPRPVILTLVPLAEKAEQTGHKEVMCPVVPGYGQHPNPGSGRKLVHVHEFSNESTRMNRSLLPKGL